LHLAALADVDKCETEKELAYKINVIGTRNIVTACRKFNKKLIHISTDFVFSGDVAREYFEDDSRKSCNYYAETKILAEDEVTHYIERNNYIILRISHPYKLLVDNEPKKSFFQKMYELLVAGRPLSAIEDFYSRPTFIDDIANCIDKLIKLNLYGTYHCVGDSLLNGAEEAEIICDIFGFDKKLIKKVALGEYFQGRARRPRSLNLNNDKIKKAAGVRLHNFRGGLMEIKASME
jgi:dTDP-4-dehydrorhamnose reductase